MTWCRTFTYQVCFIRTHCSSRTLESLIYSLYPDTKDLRIDAESDMHVV